jgi:hypothetical protein
MPPFPPFPPLLPPLFSTFGASLYSRETSREVVNYFAVFGSLLDQTANPFERASISLVFLDSSTLPLHLAACCVPLAPC